jgi:hypothetical protein
MDKNLWEALNNVDLTISKLISLVDVLEIHPISNQDIIKILEQLIAEFSENNDKVWSELKRINETNKISS